MVRPVVGEGRMVVPANLDGLFQVRVLAAEDVDRGFVDGGLGDLLSARGNVAAVGLRRCLVMSPALSGQSPPRSIGSRRERGVPISTHPSPPVAGGRIPPKMQRPCPPFPSGSRDSSGIYSPGRDQFPRSPRALRWGSCGYTQEPRVFEAVDDALHCRRLLGFVAVQEHAEVNELHAWYSVSTDGGTDGGVEWLAGTVPG